MSTRATDALIGASNADAYTWRPLRVLTIYRMVIVGAIALLALGTGDSPLLETEQPRLFFIGSLTYLGLAAFAYALVSYRHPPFLAQVYGQVGMDLLAIAVLIYATGTLGNGLGVLMVVAVAASSILLMSVRMACFFAALATLLLLGQQIFTHLAGGTTELDYTQVGFLGIGIFVTAVVGTVLARRARENQALADRRGVDIANLEALNDHIVQRLQDGVIALDGSDRIRLINHAARQALARRRVEDTPTLASLAPEIQEALARWREQRSHEEEALETPRGEYALRFRLLGKTPASGTLVFLEDRAELRERVQQAKLASLGRLTASISHEIRNPLSAISHAGQLLEESGELNKGDRRLLEIIRNQGERLNGVIESVLQLSRGQAAQRSEFTLKPWLDEFIQEFKLQEADTPYILTASVLPSRLAVTFDREHLHQILSNLCSNALKHGGAQSPRRIHLHGYRQPSGRPALDISDDGQGINDEVRERLFEPFYTTASSGTGLGLYLCRELCERNQAKLQLVNSKLGCCFRISFGKNAEQPEPSLEQQGDRPQ